MVSHQQNACAKERSDKTTARLHAVAQTSFRFFERKYGVNIHCNILSGRSYKRNDYQKDNELKVGLQIQKCNRKNDGCIKQFRNQNQAFQFFGTARFVVDKWCPQKFQRPGQLYQLQQSNRRKRVILLTHDDRHHRRKKAHGNGLRNVQTEQYRKFMPVFFAHNIRILMRVLRRPARVCLFAQTVCPKLRNKRRCNVLQ